MTNEEAIAIIKSECYVMNLLNLDRTQMINKALDKAIEALEQQPCEGNVCKDCYYNDGEVHAECVICDKAESEDKE